MDSSKTVECHNFWTVWAILIIPTVLSSYLKDIFDYYHEKNVELKMNL